MRFCNRGCGAVLPENQKAPRCRSCAKELNDRAKFRRLDEYRASERVAAKRRRAKLKREFIEAYGGRCVCCGEQSAAFLTLEHTYGDGKQHRQAVKGSGGACYLDLRKRGWPKDGYALMCFNCNMARSQGGTCPHQFPRNLSKPRDDTFTAETVLVDEVDPLGRW